MNQTCKVCGEPAAGFHFGAFTCEGCKSFFGRSYNNLSSISECKNNGKCVIDKKNRTTCKACRLRKCYTVGMSKGGSRYGRRSNWFKIHCLLQEQQQQAVEAASKAASNGTLSTTPNNCPPFGDMAAVVAAQQQFSQRSSHLGAPHLGYPSYLPEMSTSPFMSAAALPFFSMMNTLPTINASGSPQSAFQMPTHLLFPNYHSAAAAAYSSEMFKHRQSVDSVGSGESQTRFSPATHNSSQSFSQNDTQHQVPQQEQEQHQQLEQGRESPELCVSGDDDEHDAKYTQSSLSPVASLTDSQPKHESNTFSRFNEEKSITNIEAPFSEKIQSISPVSVCFISCETSNLPTDTDEPINQDSPIDLSMKTPRSFEHSDSDMLSVTSEEQNIRRRLCQLEAGVHENSDNSSDSEALKRQEAAESAFNTFRPHHNQRGIMCI